MFDGYLKYIPCLENVNSFKLTVAQTSVLVYSGSTDTSFLREDVTMSHYGDSFVQFFWESFGANPG